MQSYLEEVRRKLRIAVYKRGLSLRRLGADCELDIAELRMLLNEGMASDTCLGRLHAYFHVTREERLRGIEAAVRNEAHVERWRICFATWRELRETWGVYVRNPRNFISREADYRETVRHYYDYLAKRKLLKAIGRPPPGVILNDAENYWEWKKKLSRVMSLPGLG